MGSKKKQKKKGEDRQTMEYHAHIAELHKPEAIGKAMSRATDGGVDNGAVRRKTITAKIGRGGLNLYYTMCWNGRRGCECSENSDTKAARRVRERSDTYRN